MPDTESIIPSRPQVEVFIAASIDGFIARPDGSLDWLMRAQASAPAGEDFGYADFMASIDALVMGRKTFETVLGFDPWPYGERPVWVMSRRQASQIPESLTPWVRHGGSGARTLLRKLAQQGIRRVYLDGGELIQHFLLEDLIDRITLTTVPLLLGQGRRLWGPLPADRNWTLEAARHWECGFVQCRFGRPRDARYTPVVGKSP